MEGTGSRCPRSLVSWHRGTIERIRGRALYGNVAWLSTIARRNRSPRQLLPPPFTEILLQPRLRLLNPHLAHTHTSHQRPTPSPRSIRLRRRLWCCPHLFNNNNIQLKYCTPPSVSLSVVEPLPAGHRLH